MTRHRRRSLWDWLSQAVALLCRLAQLADVLKQLF
jgi:hypothetical protein